MLGLAIWHGSTAQPPLIETEVANSFSIGSSPSCGCMLRELAAVQAIVQEQPDGMCALYVFPGVRCEITAVGVHRDDAVCYVLAGPDIEFTLGPYRFRITGLPIDPSATLRDGAFITVDDTERELLDAVRRRPYDDAVREVYADWLEIHGFDLRARFLRAENAAAQPGAQLVVRSDHLAPEHECGWRAIVSRGTIRHCKAVNCPRTWDRLALTANHTLRWCRTCGCEVTYATSSSEARARRRLVIDAGLAEGYQSIEVDSGMIEDTRDRDDLT